MGWFIKTSVDFDGGGGSGSTEKENATSINGTGCGGGGGGGDQFSREPCRCMIDLFDQVNDPKTDELICWGATRTSFIIRNHNKFAEELLPHKNLSTFTRMLSKYVSNQRLFLPTVRVLDLWVLC